tara:strand:+ start:79 stop:1290 length:1212 start_codon:yes stop_codon:yes gene_type:complete
MNKLLLLSLLVLFGCSKDSEEEAYDDVNTISHVSLYQHYNTKKSLNSIKNRLPVLFNNVHTIVNENFADDFAIIDYNNDGYYDFITGGTDYQSSFNGIVQRNPFKFYYNSGGNLVYDTDNSSKFSSLIHGKTAIVNDYNNDGYDDVLFVGHGLDVGSPCCEYPIILENDKYGSFNQINLINAVGYWHHATTGDINGNGLIDIILTSPKPEGEYKSFFIEYKNNNYQITEWNNELPYSKTFNKFTVESIDLNNDGIEDMIYGGTEYNNSGFYRDNWLGSFIKLSTNEIILIPNESYKNTMVYDFQVHDLDKDGDLDLFILRSSGTTQKQNYLQVLRNDINDFVDITKENILSDFGGDIRIYKIIITDSDNDGVYEIRNHTLLPFIVPQSNFVFDIVGENFIRKN